LSEHDTFMSVAHSQKGGGLSQMYISVHSLTKKKLTIIMDGYL